MLRRLFSKLWSPRSSECVRLEGELLERLANEGALTLNRRLAKSFRTDCGHLLRAACALAGRERLHILAKPDEPTIFISNMEYAEFIRREEAETGMEAPGETAAAEAPLLDLTEETFLPLGGMTAVQAERAAAEADSAMLARMAFDGIAQSKPTQGGMFAQNQENQPEKRLRAERTASATSVRAL